MGKHTLPCNYITYIGYPENRKMSGDSQREVNKFGKLRVKPTEIRTYVKKMESAPKPILGRDIRNVRWVIMR